MRSFALCQFYFLMKVFNLSFLKTIYLKIKVMQNCKMLDFSFYDLFVGIDLKMLFRWVMFFRVFVFNRRENKFCMSTKTWIDNFIKTFAPTPFDTRSENLLLNAHKLGAPNQCFLNFEVLFDFRDDKTQKGYSSIACLICSISSQYILLLIEWYLWYHNNCWNKILLFLLDESYLFLITGKAASVSHISITYTHTPLSLVYLDPLLDEWALCSSHWFTCSRQA